MLSGEVIAEKFGSDSKFVEGASQKEKKRKSFQIRFGFFTQTFQVLKTWKV